MAAKKKPVKKTGQTQAQKDKVEKYKKDQAAKSSKKDVMGQKYYDKKTAKSYYLESFKATTEKRKINSKNPIDQKGISDAKREMAMRARSSGPSNQITRAVRLNGAVIGQKKLKKKK